MGAGNYALIEFIKYLRTFMLGALEKYLLAIMPDTKRDNILFRAIPEPGEDLPVEEEPEITQPLFISRMFPKYMWKRYRRQ